MTPAEWLIYSNQGATRNLPIDPALAQAFGFLPELGIQMEVFSGGQPAKGTSSARVGSTRHDHGRSADVFFRKEGRRLDWSNPNDVPIFQDVVKRARAAGVTGFGAGPGYMQPGSMHVGFGAPAVWGAGGKGANAPEWLRQAFAGATPGQAVANDTMAALGRQPMGQTMQMSSKSGPMGLLGAMPEDEPGGLLGLLGKKPGWASKANDIGAVLLALSGSPAAAPLLQQVQDRKKDKRETARINQTVQWLQSQGRGDLAEAVAAGTLGGSDAAKIALTPADPMAALQMQAAELGLQKSQLELDAMRNPQPDPGYRLLSADEVQSLGLPQGAYQAGPDGKISQVGGGGQTINVDASTGGGKFEEAFAKGDADTINTVYTAGLQAQRNIGRIDQLDALLKSAPSGAEGALKLAAGEFGINTEGLSEIQAAQAMVNSLVPEQRQPGSGPMSDADLALFKQSLPRIINQPGGNDVIIQTMRGIAQYDAEGAAIVQRLRMGEIDRAQAFDMLQSRQNPLAGFKAPAGGATPAPGGDTSPSGESNGVKWRVIQ
jgi:hypothetical protein